jgi:2-polyprenyl-6-methoxyphenol hydroxylase-like FAD-dependent oxidoreductase
MNRPVGTNWVGPGRHVVHYPVHGGELMNFVGIVERGDWRVESWTTKGTAGECAADFAGWHEDVHAMIRNAPSLYKWALLGREPMERWTQGAVTLLGDACHPMLPMLAQGAVMAIEDGVVLARCLERYEPREALARYESARKERTRRAVLGSAQNAERFHNPQLADAAGAQEYVDREWSEARVKDRYEWLFTYDATSAQI